nr:pentapeptide repeat-containing protein [Methylocella silvestris]
MSIDVRGRMMARTRKPVARAETGILLVRDSTLKAEWPKFVANIVKVVGSGFAIFHGHLDHIPEGISSLVEAAGAISIDAPPGERGWLLFALGFAWAFDELRARGQLDDIGVETAVRDALAEAKERVDQGEQIIPTSFLDQPTTLPLYRLVRDSFVERKGAFRAAGGEKDDILRARFDAAFDRAIFLLWSQSPEQYQPLAAALNAPGAAAHAFRLEWDAYRKGLIHEFEVKPVFGQETLKIALSQIYVPLRGVWREEHDDPRPPSRSVKTRALTLSPSRWKASHFVWLDDELDAWATGGHEEYELKLLGGGPGSGKSTIAKALARRLAARDDCRPLFISLANIDAAIDLREAINAHFTKRTANPFRQPPLARNVVEDGPPLVLIFDGLDELARPGEAANDIARDFMGKLGQLTSELRGDKKSRLRVIVTGRMPSFQAAQRFAGAVNRKSYEVVGFLPIKGAELFQTSEEFGGKGLDVASGVLESVLTVAPPQKAAPEQQSDIARIDQRETWWKGYAAAVGLSLKPPHALSAPALTELTREPLLCYLLVLSGYLTEGAQLAAGNLNLIYRELIDEVWRRGWGDDPDNGRRPGAGRFLSQEGFNRLMETIALAGWQGGDTRVCSEARFHNAARSLRTGNAWDDFVRDNGSDITNLAMNFYLKNAEIETRGFEFTHKSFGDYLAGRALLEVALDLITLIDRRPETAMKEWFDVTATGNLTNELLDHMRRELQLRASSSEGLEEVRALKSGFERLASAVIRDGLPANGNADQPWRVAEARQRNAEVMVWAVLNACSLAIAATDPERAKIEVAWPDKAAFGNLLRRVVGQTDLTTSFGPKMFYKILFFQFQFAIATAAAPVMKCFAYLVAPEADLTGQALFAADLQHADLRRARLELASLRTCKLKGTNLSNANFSGSVIETTDFEDANLEGAQFNDAKLLVSPLDKASVKGATLLRTLILPGKGDRGADLKRRGANVTGVQMADMLRKPDSV